MLISYNADLNIADLQGRFPIHWACASKNRRCLEVRLPEVVLGSIERATSASWWTLLRSRSLRPVYRQQLLSVAETFSSTRNTLSDGQGCWTVVIALYRHFFAVWLTDLRRRYARNARCVRMDACTGTAGQQWWNVEKMFVVGLQNTQFCAANMLGMSHFNHVKLKATPAT